MSFSIDSTDLKAYMTRVEAGILEAGKSSVRRAAVIAWEDARETTIFKDRTGKLRDSIQLVERVSDYEASIRAKAKYAIFVEGGTRPHTITARGGGMLVFRVNGQTVFRRSVKHPGTQERPFMRRAGHVGELALFGILQRETAAACE